MNLSDILSKRYADYNPRVSHTPELCKEWGVWRWEGYHRFRTLLVEILQGSILDIGGASGPLGFGADILDIQDVDIHGLPVFFSDISQAEGQYDIIHSSHCLEHFYPVYKTVKEWSKRLKMFGVFILHVPLWYMGSLHPDNHPAHKWAFSYDGNTFIETKSKILPLKPILDRFFYPVIAALTINGCLFYIGIKKIPGAKLYGMDWGNQGGN